MAIFKAGPAIGAISGNVGGTNFANTRNGPVVRKARSSSSNKAITQGNAQVNLRTQIARWNALSTASRTQWNNYAKSHPISNRIGVQRQLSGYQMFLKHNLHFEVDDPPSATLSTTAVNVSFESSVASGIDINFTNLPAFTAYAGFVYGALLYRSTPVRFVRDFRKLGLVSVLGTTPASLDTIWQTVFPLPVENQYIALQFRPFAGSVDLGGWTTEVLQTTA